METKEYLYYGALIIIIITSILIILKLFGAIGYSEPNGTIDCKLKWDDSGNLSRLNCKMDSEKKY